MSNQYIRDFHVRVCERIMQDVGDYRVIIFGDHAWNACQDYFPREKVLNHGSIAHGSVIGNNWHREEARDNFLLTVDRASAFLSGAKLLIKFENADKSDFLHIGNDPNKVRITSCKEKQHVQGPVVAEQKRLREVKQTSRSSCTKEAAGGEVS